MSDPLRDALDAAERMYRAVGAVTAGDKSVSEEYLLAYAELGDRLADARRAAPPPEAGLHEWAAGREAEALREEAAATIERAVWYWRGKQVAYREIQSVTDAVLASPADPPSERCPDCGAKPGKPHGQTDYGRCDGYPTEVPADPDMEERLRDEIDAHWLYRDEDGVFRCTADDWSHGPDDRIEEGQRFAPFASHIAARLIAQGWRR